MPSATRDAVVAEPGQYDKLATVYDRAVNGQDAFGEAQRPGVQVARVWVAVEPLSGRELEIAQQVHERAQYRVRLRRFRGLTTRMYFQVGEAGALLNIVHIADRGLQGVEHVCLCELGREGQNVSG